METFPYQNFSEAIDALDRETDSAAKQWLAENKKISLFTAVTQMGKGFWKTYYKENKKRMGVPGLFLSVNEGMRPFLTYAKYWELRRNHQNR